MLHQEGNFDGFDDFGIFYQSWLPKQDPSAVLLVAHGLAEHSGRYGNLVDCFVPKGYAIWALDHRGHGRSQGDRAHVDRFSEYAIDIGQFLDIVRGKHPEAKIFLLGHSMGGAIGLSFALRQQSKLAGLILSGPLVKVGEGISPLTIVSGRIASVLMPRARVVMLDSSLISRDPKVVEAYDNDPLVFRGKITARLGAELIGTMQSFPKQVSDLQLPLLILQGTADKLVNPRGSEWLFEAAGSRDKTLHRYEGLFHEIFNEPEHKEVFDDIETWLATRLVSRQTD